MQTLNADEWIDNEDYISNFYSDFLFDLPLSTLEICLTREFFELFKIIHHNFNSDEMINFPKYLCSELITNALTEIKNIKPELAVDLMEFLIKNCIFVDEVLSKEIYLEANELVFGEITFVENDLLMYHLFILDYILFNVEDAKEKIQEYNVYILLKVKLQELKRRDDYFGIITFCFFEQIILNFSDIAEYMDLMITIDQLDEILTVYENDEFQYIKISICQCLVELSKYDKNHKLIIRNINRIFEILKENDWKFCYQIIYFLSDSKFWKKIPYDNEFFITYGNYISDIQNERKFEFNHPSSAPNIIFKIFQIKTKEKLKNILNIITTKSEVVYFKNHENSTFTQWFVNFDSCISEEWVKEIYNLKHLHFSLLFNAFKEKPLIKNLCDPSLCKFLSILLKLYYNKAPPPFLNLFDLQYFSIFILLEIYELGILTSNQFIQDLLDYGCIHFISSFCIKDIYEKIRCSNKSEKSMKMKILKYYLKILCDCLIKNEKVDIVLNNIGFVSVLQNTFIVLNVIENVKTSDYIEEIFLCHFLTLKLSMKSEYIENSFKIFTDNFHEEMINFPEKYFFIMKNYLEMIEKFLMKLKDLNKRIKYFNQLLKFLNKKLNDKLKYLIIEIFYKRSFERDFYKIILQNNFHMRIKKKVKKKFKKGRHLLENFLFEIKRNKAKFLVENKQQSTIKNKTILIVFDSNDWGKVHELKIFVESNTSAELQFVHSEGKTRLA